LRAARLTTSSHGRSRAITRLSSLAQLIAPASDGGVANGVYGYPLTTDGNLVGVYSAINACAQMPWALFSGVDTASPTLSVTAASEAGSDFDAALTSGNTDAMAVIAAFIRTVSTMTAETGSTLRHTSNEATFGSSVGVATSPGVAGGVNVGLNLGGFAEAYGGAILLRGVGGSTGMARLIGGKLIGGVLVR
jgi:hypothetical protein